MPPAVFLADLQGASGTSLGMCWCVSFSYVPYWQLPVLLIFAFHFSGWITALVTIFQLLATLIF